MKICFIDNNPHETCRVMEAIKEYYMEKAGEELETLMILVNMCGTNVVKETIAYYKNVLSKQMINLEVCESVDSIKQKLGSLDVSDTVVLVDLHMVDEEEKKIEEDGMYKCISMQCMDELNKLGMKYFWYSSYAESEFKDKWQKRFRELYKEKVPIIYERSELSSGHFKQKIAKEILGV